MPEGLRRIAAGRPSVRTQARKTTGRIQALVILADFPDNQGQRDPQEFSDLLFSLGTYPTGSMRDYYSEVSYGKLDVTGHVTSWLRMPKPYSYYVNGESGMSAKYPENSQGLTEDALKAAARLVDFREFDQDGDGFLDGLFIVHAGSGAEVIEDADTRRQMIWSHKWHLKEPLTLGGVKAYAYSIEPENGVMGVFAHEFGHVLGLPDLYDTTNRSAGAGMWCLMASGSWGGGGRRPTHLCAWSKAHLGWLKPKNITDTNTIELMAIEDSAISYRLWTDGKSGQEYFLLENRQAQGFDEDLPGTGLLIWHIDDGQSDNDDPRHYRVGLEQADGKRDLERGQNEGDDSDPYPGDTGSTLFDDASKPNSRDYFGDPTNVEVRRIRQLRDGKIKGDVKV
ncbi:MAG: M6 family metalloprotease domain-containing protein [Blastocatellia bacterium]|nr:M6 family metalloprotease domain-containing protein [Blastocatellia bacterium]